MDNSNTSTFRDIPGQPEAPEILQELFDDAGITFNGDAPWDIQVYDRKTYERMLTKGSLGMGEAYMDGMWQARELDQLFTRLLAVDMNEKVVSWSRRIRLVGEILRQKLFNLQSTKRSFQVGEQHYDIGNDVFEAMLDPTMSYTCGYWHDATNLEQAQLAKLNMICRKLELQKGERLLDIGCGWGGLARYAAENYDVEVVGITVSKEQQYLAQENCKGLSVSIELQDYRDLKGQFDKIVSVGMFEHVGTKNYKTYFETANRLLKDDGLFLLHTIGDIKTSPNTDAWIDKYIFPNGKLPSARQLARAIENQFIIEDWHNFGQDYDKTLMAWWKKFDNAWPELQHKYSQRFYRMWKYYLQSCAGFFRSRQGQLWQVVLSKRQRNEMYRSVR